MSRRSQIRYEQDVTIASETAKIYDNAHRDIVMSLENLDEIHGILQNHAEVAKLRFAQAVLDHLRVRTDEHLINFIDGLEPDEIEEDVIGRTQDYYAGMTQGRIEERERLIKLLDDQRIKVTSYGSPSIQEGDTWITVGSVIKLIQDSTAETTIYFDEREGEALVSIKEQN